MTKSRVELTSLFRALVIILSIAITASSQVAEEARASAPEVRTEKLGSRLMAREVSYRIILPVGYFDQASSSKKFPVVYLLHGLFGHFDNWTDKTKLTTYAPEYNFIIVNPEGGDNKKLLNMNVRGKMLEMVYRAMQ